MVRIYMYICNLSLHNSHAYAYAKCCQSRVEVKNVSKIVFVPPFRSNGTVEQLNSNGKTAFACFRTVQSVVAPDQPFVHPVVSFLVRRVYT